MTESHERVFGNAPGREPTDLFYLNRDGTEYILTSDGVFIVKGRQTPDTVSRFMEPILVDDWNDIVYPWEGLKTEIRVVSVTDVSGIPDKAFFRCPNLLAVNVFDGVKAIGFKAFAECPSLTFVAPMPGVATQYRSFEECPSLTEASKANISSIGGGDL